MKHTCKNCGCEYDCRDFGCDMPVKYGYCSNNCNELDEIHKTLLDINQRIAKISAGMRGHKIGKVGLEKQRGDEEL